MKPSPVCRRGRPPKKRQFPSLSDYEGSTPQIQPQPVDPCGIGEELQINPDSHSEQSTPQSQDDTEEPTRRGEKRGAESDEEAGDAAVDKRFCSEQMEQPTSETCARSSESAVCEAEAVGLEEVIDVETISLTSVGDSLQRDEKDKDITSRETLVDEEIESSNDEIIHVDGDADGIMDLQKDTERLNKAEKECFQSRTAPTLFPFVSPRSHSNKGVSLGSTGSWEDEDIDVIGGSSPLPDPVIISWSESSEGEQEHEDVDVVGEKTDNTSFHCLPCCY